ncbi:MAG: DJ-1/PfpI family protein [Myxococcota bacterium]|nr:DJ-1/PfpI family protein [Myxococcota bacterium]
MPFTIGILLYPGAEELDWAGPFEVFSIATAGVDDARVVTLAERPEPVRSWNGLRVLPDYEIARAPDLDLIVVPGGFGTREEMDNPVLVDWLAQIGPNCTWIASVCTGSLLLHAAGLTHGKQITTHWAVIEELRNLAPEATVLEGMRYVRDGNLVTAAGVSAGIDMSLWLVGQIWDVERARNTQRMMEYDPAPPYAAQV